ncbi:MAG: hypothetical protein M3290_12675, partial [Actinomycetota bacterium]|nr:hypothetical protein [Actinomycetota bacterium]
MTANDDDLTGELIKLYSAPLERFTVTRNELVKELSTEGRREAAASLKARRKPSVAVWTINQLARSHDDLMAELLRARSDLSSARSAQEMRAAVDRRKAAVSALLTVARDVLSEAGHPASAQTLDAISRALLTSPDGVTAEEMRLGILAEEPRAAALDDGLGAAFTEAVASKSDSDARDRAQALADAASKAEREAQDVRWQADRARDEAERLSR